MKEENEGASDQPQMQHFKPGISRGGDYENIPASFLRGSFFQGDLAQRQIGSLQLIEDGGRFGKGGDISSEVISSSYASEGHLAGSFIIRGKIPEDDSAWFYSGRRGDLDYNMVWAMLRILSEGEVLHAKFSRASNICLLGK